jgi:hypothetical protein
MADRMDALLAALDRQGFRSWQADSGMWMFSRGYVTITFHRTPVTAGLDFPEE